MVWSHGLLSRLHYLSSMRIKKNGETKKFLKKFDKQMNLSMWRTKPLIIRLSCCSLFVLAICRNYKTIIFFSVIFVGFFSSLICMVDHHQCVIYFFGWNHKKKVMVRCNRSSDRCMFPMNCSANQVTWK